MGLQEAMRGIDTAYASDSSTISSFDKKQISIFGCKYIQ
jgi:hypothetical protein